MNQLIRLLAIVGAMAISANARAEQSSGHVDLSVQAGYAPGQARHPNYVGENVHTLLREVNLGFSVNRYLVLGAQFSHFEMPVEEVSRDKYARRGSDTQAVSEAAVKAANAGKANAPIVRGGCDNCPPQSEGGDEIAGSMAIMSGGLYADFTPLGKDGFFTGISCGAAMIQLEGNEVGGALAVRSGYRFFPVPRFAIGLQAGLESVIAEEAHAWLAFIAAELHFRFFY